MPQTLNVNLTAAAPSGGSVSISEAVSVEAVHKTKVTVPEDAVDFPVVVNGGLASLMDLFAVKPSTLGSKTGAMTLSYKVGSVDSDQPIRLDGAHVFRGAGAAALIADVDGRIDTLYFTNDLGADVEVEILIARDATP